MGGGGSQKLTRWNSRFHPGYNDYYTDYDDYTPSPGVPFQCTVDANEAGGQQLGVRRELGELGHVVLQADAGEALAQELPREQVREAGQVAGVGAGVADGLLC